MIGEPFHGGLLPNRGRLVLVKDMHLAGDTTDVFPKALPNGFYAPFPNDRDKVWASHWSKCILMKKGWSVDGCKMKEISQR